VYLNVAIGGKEREAHPAMMQGTAGFDHQIVEQTPPGHGFHRGDTHNFRAHVLYNMSRCSDLLKFMQVIYAPIAWPILHMYNPDCYYLSCYT
jgi:hypothetical protein